MLKQDFIKELYNKDGTGEYMFNEVFNICNDVIKYLNNNYEINKIKKISHFRSDFINNSSYLKTSLYNNNNKLVSVSSGCLSSYRNVSSFSAIINKNTIFDDNKLEFLQIYFKIWEDFIGYSEMFEIVDLPDSNCFRINYKKPEELNNIEVGKEMYTISLLATSIIRAFNFTKYITVSYLIVNAYKYFGNSHKALEMVLSMPYYQYYFASLKHGNFIHKLNENYQIRSYINKGIRNEKSVQTFSHNNSSLAGLVNKNYVQFVYYMLLQDFKTADEFYNKFWNEENKFNNVEKKEVIQLISFYHYKYIKLNKNYEILSDFYDGKNKKYTIINELGKKQNVLCHKFSKKEVILNQNNNLFFNNLIFNNNDD